MRTWRFETWEENGEWVASCLALAVHAFGKTEMDALRHLPFAIGAQIADPPMWLESKIRSTWPDLIHTELV